MKRILTTLKSKWPEYILEILVITLGILGAYMLNNWNEEKKSIKKGQEILVDVRENIEANTIQFQADIETNRSVIRSIDIVLDNITNIKVYSDSIDKHLRFSSWWATPRWKSSGYEALVDHGVDIIQSKELRKSIIDLYEITLIEIDENSRLQEGNWIAMLPNWLELIYRSPDDFRSADEHTARPFDYQEIVESRMFRSMLTFLRSQRLADIQYRNLAIEEHNALIQLINGELQN
ncbi:MAG: hypothetical protein HEP71_24630 [Roseivirga sp.]|nr:hypothetical protein [Roseivirga sp.]